LAALQRRSGKERGRHAGDERPGDGVVVAPYAAHAAFPVELRVLSRPLRLRPIEGDEVARPPRIAAGGGGGGERLEIEVERGDPARVHDEQAVGGLHVGERFVELRSGGRDAYPRGGRGDLVAIPVRGPGGGDDHRSLGGDRAEPRLDVPQEYVRPE